VSFCKIKGDGYYIIKKVRRKVELMKKIIAVVILLLCSVVFFTAGAENTDITYTDFTVTENNRDIIGFKGTENEELIIPETFKGEDGVWYRVTEIDLFAFASCSELRSITLPGSITRVGEYAFLNCPNLRRVNIESVSAWCNIDFDNQYANPLSNRFSSLYLSNEKLTVIDIPEGIKEIKPYAFFGCRSIESVSVPSSVAKIRESAFFDCRSLKTITLSKGLKSIGRGSFAYCALESLVLPDGFTDTEWLAFYNCRALSSLEIPDSMEFFGDLTFHWCVYLADIQYKGTRAQWDEVYRGWGWHRSLCTITCPEGELPKYKDD